MMGLFGRTTFEEMMSITAGAAYPGAIYRSQYPIQGHLDGNNFVYKDNGIGQVSKINGQYCDGALVSFDPYPSFIRLQNCDDIPLYNDKYKKFFDLYEL
jgi:hypothetical protein